MFLSLAFLALGARVNADDLDQKVNAALAKMTQEEKLRLIGGYRGFDVQPIESIGAAPVRMSDGPVGVRNFGPTTAYSSGVCLAATFDEKLMHDMGDGIGKDARGRGVGFWLGPGVNLARNVQNGRNFEYFGEDPCLASRCAVNVIQGVQAHGVAATVKHFALNNHENDRMQDSSDADEKVMRELYLKPFEAAVKEAKVWAVMCSYNKINGAYASANKFLETDVLKTDWGFKGVLMSDWGAVHEDVGVFNAGLDLEMPGADFMKPSAISAALASGTVSQALLDDKVRRILYVCAANGMLGAARTPTSPKDDPTNSEVALHEAEEGTVLLKNNGLLPLTPGPQDVLVIGPNALKPVVGGGGSSYTTPLHEQSLFDALKAKFTGAHTLEGAADLLGNPYAFASYDDLSVSYFKGKTLAGDAVSTQAEKSINHVWTNENPSPAGMLDFSARWVGHFTVANSGSFIATTRSDDGIRVWIDGKQVIDHWDDHGEETDTVNLSLTSGRHDIKVEYYQGIGEAIAKFGLVDLGKIKQNPELSQALAKADAVVVGVGFNAATESEGRDRSFDLPFEQQMLLDAATSQSKKVIIVVNSGAGVNLAPWVGKAAAILQAWYPGQEGALALARIIDGEVNPSGKLPMTFPASLAGTYYADAYPPVNHHVAYKEGLLIGYRWFDAKGQKPLFPFGFGLSYTTFSLSETKVSVVGDEIHVSTKVSNTGKQNGGSEVVQIYVGPKRPAPGEPVKQLKSFARVSLPAEDFAKVDKVIPIKELATWDTPNHRWVVTPGDYVVYVGTSSVDVHAYPITVKQAMTFGP